MKRWLIPLAAFSSIATAGVATAMCPMAFGDIVGDIVGTGPNGQGYTSRLLLDQDGDGETDRTVLIESPNKNLTDRIQDAIDNGFTKATVIDSDNDSKLDANEEAVFEQP